MTSKALGLALALACLAAPGARAEDAEVISRAQRDAANPLRMIIEASKVKPRQKAGEPEPAAKAPPQRLAPPPPATRPAVAKTAPARDPRPESEASVAPAAAAAEAPAEAEQPSSMQASTEPEKAAPPPEPAVQASQSMPAPAEESAPYDPDNYFGAAPPLPTGSGKFPVLAPASRLAPAAAALATMPLPLAALQLAAYVEPAFPDRVRRKLLADGEVILGFTVNPDGSVADVAVRSASDKALEATAVDAVRQWRYQPIAAAQAHAVQLVFKLRE